jgi:hypothetical protein
MTSAGPALGNRRADHCPAMPDRSSMASAPVVMTGRNSFLQTTSVEWPTRRDLFGADFLVAHQ